MFFPKEKKFKNLSVKGRNPVSSVETTTLFLLKEETDMIDPTLSSFKKADVFSPDHISEKMASFLKKSGSLLEPAVGTGNLLKFIDINLYNQVDVYDIKEEYLDTIDLNVNKHHCDFITSKIECKYDNIILNPPYIRFQDLSENYRKYIKDQWKILNQGNIDIYYAFLLKCLDLLANDGVMIAIIPNSYIYNKSAKKLRKFFIENQFIQEIIDYSSEKVFKNISCYCCITVFTKKKKDSLLFNNETLLYSNLKEASFYSPVELLPSAKLDDLVFIKNGIATLRDKIYIHPVKKFDEPVWKPITSVFKNAWVIFPYINGKIMDENELRTNNPLTYAFLEENKEELAKRDKGNKKYPMWYSFGRSQSLVMAPSRAIYVPTLVDPKNINYTILEPTLFISSLCIYPKKETISLESILSILERNKDIIIKNSSKRGSGWLNLSSSTLKELR